MIAIQNDTSFSSLPATRSGLLKISAVSERFGISPQCIRQATENGSLACFRTPGGMRLFDEAAVLEWLGVAPETNDGPIEDCPIAMICRVSSNGQNRATGNAEKSSLEHQQERVEEYCQNRFGKLGKLYKSVGSGLNFDRPELVALIEDVLAGKYRGGYIVATDASRLARFGVSMIEKICEFGGATIVFTMTDDEAKEHDEDQAQIVSQIIDLMTFFTAKISGQKAKNVNTAQEVQRVSVRKCSARG